MKKISAESVTLEGPSGTLSIYRDDKIALQLAMLIEGECMGHGPTKTARKYDYTKQRYFQLLRAFQKGGTAAIMPKKTGPKTNFVRTENVVTQIIRYRFLDPDASAEVIAQKMRQTGIKVSTRSIERTFTEHGLQKKNFTRFVQKTQHKRLKRT